MRNKAKLRGWVRDLRAAFPTLHPVRVVQVDPKRLKDKGDNPLGDFTAYRNQAGELTNFTIRLDKTASARVTADTLLHEMAHVFREYLPAMPGDSPHDDVFNAIYGRLYRWWINEREDAVQHEQA